MYVARTSRSRPTQKPPALCDPLPLDNASEPPYLLPGQTVSFIQRR